MGNVVERIYGVVIELSLVSTIRVHLLYFPAIPRMWH